MRSSGILMHISSLPSPYGIGTMGKEARKFIDFLADAGQSYWQVLPVGPTSYGDSPYQSFSAFAGNPYFIDLDLLVEQGLLKKKECEGYEWGVRADEVDYGLLYQNRYVLFRKAFKRFRKMVPQDYASFVEEQSEWLEDYALFMALKDENGGAEWSKWDRPLRFRKPKAIGEAKSRLSKEIEFYKMLQYLFYKQWNEMKSYANGRGIRIIGDTPIYVSSDSADVWANPESFYLDEELLPIDVAGCPPDAFSEDGQLWGNPLFRWDVMKEDSYGWWTRRVAHMTELFDVVRIDHFRGFDSYYAIPYGDATAKNGEWREGPGLALFQAMEKKLGKLDIIVEDLGFLTDSVRKLVADSGFPGMKVLQFAFDSREDSDYLPHNYTSHCVVYTGTHDNDTIRGWMKTAPKESVRFAKDYLRLTKEEGYHWGMMKAAWASVGELAIVTMQDLLGLGGKARMNTPSTQGGNWKWRMKKGAADERLARKVRANMQIYARLPRKGDATGTKDAEGAEDTASKQEGASTNEEVGKENTSSAKDVASTKDASGAKDVADAKNIESVKDATGTKDAGMKKGEANESNL